MVLATTILVVAIMTVVDNGTGAMLANTIVHRATIAAMAATMRTIHRMLAPAGIAGVVAMGTDLIRIGARMAGGKPAPDPRG